MKFNKSMVMSLLRVQYAKKYMLPYLGQNFWEEQDTCASCFSLSGKRRRQIKYLYVSEIFHIPMGTTAQIRRVIYVSSQSSQINQRD